MKLLAAINDLGKWGGSSEGELRKKKNLKVQIAHGKKGNIWLALLMKCIYPSWNIPSRFGDFLFCSFAQSFYYQTGA